MNNFIVLQVKEIIKVPVHIPKPYKVEKKIHYPVHVQVPRPVPVKVRFHDLSALFTCEC